MDNETTSGTRHWPHAPPHKLYGSGTFFVTARCVNKTAHFATPERRDYLQDRLRALSTHYGWSLEAWAVLPNHYHFVAHSPSADSQRPDPAVSLSAFLRHLHGDTARYVNREDETPGRKVWSNFRDSRLTFTESYFARLSYVHQNAVHHGLVGRAADWSWCSARAFEEIVTPAWTKTVYSFKFDQVAKDDGE